MNKTININLGGFFFHIDETAYQKLKRYLESISRSLSEDSQGKNEIIADIEARISELLSEKITDARQVVNESDIEDIIAIMGQPEDYAEAEETYSNANYASRKNNASGKKLFRDGDDKFLGGVASGIGHYFDIDAIWIRLGLLALFFGAGFGIILYIILWILLPEAKTTAEKLQMEGEPVNIDNIEKKIREEFTHVSENVKDFANNASLKIKDGANEFSEKINKTFSAKTKKNNGIEDFLNTIGNLFLVLFRVIGKFIGVILVFIAAAVILSLIIGGFSVGSIEFLNIDGNFINYPHFFYDASLPKWVLTICLFTLIGIPFIVLFILGLRILSSNVKQFSKTTSLTLLGIWLIALLAIIFTGIEFGTTHANYGKYVEKQELNITKKDTLILKMVNDDSIYYRHNLKRTYSKQEVEIENTIKLYSNYLRVDVEKSNTGKAYFVIQKESYGRSSIKARKNAEQISYKYDITNNKVVLDAFFLSDVKNIFKDEEVKITFFVPEKTTVYFDNSMRYFLMNVRNKDGIDEREMGNHHFRMKKNYLECTDCKKEEEKIEIKATI